MSNRKQQGKRGGKGAPIQQAIQGTIQEATHDPFDVLRARGLSDEVIEARGYTPFYGKDHTRLGEAKRDAVLARWDLTDKQRSDYRSKMSKTRYKDAEGEIVRDATGRSRNVGQGLLIPKHKFRETELPEIAPQLRPEVGFWRPPEEHWHDASEVKPRLKWIPDKERERHLDYAAARAYCKRRTRISGKDGAPGDVKTTIDRAYSEQVNDGGVYTRTRRRQWRPTRGAYDRTRIDGERRYRAHIREEHGGASADVLAALMTKPHEHDDEAKYTLPVGKRASRRLDVHPLAYERIHDAEIVFYSIEGSIKGDAILTRILEHDRLWSVFSTPSVTTAKAFELPRIARKVLTQERASGKRPLVVIVCDADWFENEMVRRFALFVREDVLRRWGVDACIAAAPVPDGDAAPCKCKPGPTLDADGLYCVCGGYIKGVDDFLAVGGSLEQLRVLEREGPYKLALHADPDGFVYGSWHTLRDRLDNCGNRRENVAKRLQELEARGRLEIVSGTLEPYWTAHTRWASAEMPGHLGPQRESEGHWDIGPFVLRIPEQHRVEDSFVSLGEKLAARDGRQRDGHPLGWWVIEVSAQEWISTDVGMEAERLWRLEQPVVGTAPHERHLNEAIEVLARVNKLQRDTVNEYPEVQRMRTITRRERDLSILELLRTRPDLSQKEIGRMFDVSVSTVGRIGRNGNAKTNLGAPQKEKEA